jgi:hypothetical protein
MGSFFDQSMKWSTKNRFQAEAPLSPLRRRHVRRLLRRRQFRVGQSTHTSGNHRQVQSRPGNEAARSSKSIQNQVKKAH